MVTNSLADKVAVVIINYCGLEDTIDCVDSILNGTVQPRIIYIVDNCSPDSSGTKLKETYKNCDSIKIVESSYNMGFGAGNNLGMKMAADVGCKYCLLINNDTIIDSMMIENLLDFADTDIVVSPLMFYHKRPNEIWFAGGYFDFWQEAKHIRTFKPEISTAEAIQTEWLTGCCLLLPLEAYFATSGFDEKYFLYWEDVDWSIRLQEKGYKLCIIPKAKLWHKVSASTNSGSSTPSPLTIYYTLRNRIYGCRKFKFGIKATIRILISAIFRIISIKPSNRYAFDAVLDSLSGRMGKKQLFS